MSLPTTPPKTPLKTPIEISPKPELSSLLYEDATIPGFPKAQTTGYQWGVFTLSVLGFILTALLLLPFLQVHYVLWRILLRLMGHDGGPSFLVAVALAWASAAIFFFFWQDHLAVFGNAKLKKILQDKASAILPSGKDVPHFFVSIRLSKRTDLGILYLYPDRLIFIGDVWQVTIPKNLFHSPPCREPTLPGITASWLALPIHNVKTPLRLLARDQITAISQSYEHGAALREALAQWQK
jgi:hypothetical protein